MSVADTPHLERITEAHGMSIRLALILVMSTVFATTTALADPPPWAGKGKGGHDERKGKGKGHDRDEERVERRGDSRERHFADEHRVYVREYYEEQYRRGKCPPGLAK